MARATSVTSAREEAPLPEQALAPEEELVDEPREERARPRRAASAESERAGSGLAEAQACLQRGDTRCAVAALQEGRSASEMSLLVDVYRMQGRTNDARGVMQRYVRRFPRGRDTDAYRRELGLAGQ